MIMSKKVGMCPLENRGEDSDSEEGEKMTRGVESEKRCLFMEGENPTLKRLCKTPLLRRRVKKTLSQMPRQTTDSGWGK